MEKQVQVRSFSESNGAAAIRFELDGHEKYALSICDRHKIRLHISEGFHDKLMCFGQLMLISNALKLILRVLK